MLKRDLNLDSYYYLPQDLNLISRAMVFVDGENLVACYSELLGEQLPKNHVVYEPNVFVWMKKPKIRKHRKCDIVRIYYYASAFGDESDHFEILGRLRSVGIEAPRVFKRSKERKTKGIGISLVTEMLTHAHQKNYNMAIIVAGDENYIPLVRAVKAEGHHVILWFFKDRVSKRLEYECDHAFDISTFLLKEPGDPIWRY